MMCILKEIVPSHHQIVSQTPTAKMTIIYLFVICVALQSTLVYTRTVEDVLADFQPVFDEIHSEIYNLQNLARGHGSNQVGDLRGSISQNSWATQNALEGAMYDIRDQVRMIVGEAGMMQHEDLIKHCFVKKDESISSLSKDKNVGTNVCTQLGNKAIDNLTKVLNEYYNEQSSWHTHLDYVKERCADKTTPLAMQTCLIEHLYLLEKPQIQIFRKKMDDFIDNNNEYVKRIVGDLKICSSIVSEKVINDRLPIIADFKKCVFDVAENLPKFRN